MHDDHSQDGDGEAKDALPADDADRLDGRTLEKPLLDHELGCGKDLGTGNQEHADDGAQRIGIQTAFRGGSGLEGGRSGNHFAVWGAWLGLVRVYSTGEAHDGDAGDDTDQGQPLEEVQPAAEEHDAEQADEENKRTPGHLVYRGGHHEQTGVHESGAANVADGGYGKEEDADACKHRVMGVDGLASAGAVEGRGRVYAGVVGVGDIIGATDGLVAGGLLPGHVAFAERHEADDQPAAHLTDEHLRRLDYGLLEVYPLLGVRVLAVADALVVLLKGRLALWLIIGSSRERWRHD